jgi:late competence protein required for DNA uptake (superfamily II DNA/RNA helicase)
MNTLLISKEKKKLSDELIRWSSSRERVLNITTIPYNSSEILYKVILENCKKGIKVLYITEEVEENIELINLIKKNSTFRNYINIKEDYNTFEYNLVITKCANLRYIQDKFEIIIYNGISNVVNISYEDLIGSIGKLLSFEGKIISYNFECIFNGKKEIIIPIRDNGYPLVEPMLIKTKIDLNKDLPYVAYEHLKWSLENKKKVIIYVPDKEKVNKVYCYLEKYCRNISKEVYYFTDYNKDKNELKRFLNRKSSILVTNDYCHNQLDVENTNIMVFFADNNCFNYKKLIYISGKVGRKEKNNLGEVIFLAKEENLDMEKSKNIIRNFNKEAWEKNFFVTQNLF